MPPLRNLNRLDSSPRFGSFDVGYNNESQGHAASGTFGLAASSPPTAIKDWRQGADEASRKQPRARRMTSQQGRMVGPVKKAPPATTRLPLDLMSGITSDEILTFFPNHGLTWPAITARVLADCGTIAAITSHINFRWPASKPEEELLANTQRYHIKRACQEVFGIEDDDPKWKCTVKDRATREIFEQKPWYPSGCSSFESHGPAWTLKQVGEALDSASLTCNGPFADKVFQALRSGPNFRQDRCHSQGNPSSPTNPPSLPYGWMPLFESTNDRQRLTSMHQRQSYRSAKSTFRSAKIDPQAAKDCTLDNVDTAVRGNADGIISRHYDKIAGEILLWLLREDGGNLTQQDVLGRLNGEIDNLNKSAKLAGSGLKIDHVDRSTLAYRKKAALTAQAAHEQISYQEKYNEFEECKAGVRSKRKLPIARSLKPPEGGALSRRRRKRWQPYESPSLILGGDDPGQNTTSGSPTDLLARLEPSSDYVPAVGAPDYSAWDNGTFDQNGPVEWDFKSHNTDENNRFDPNDLSSLLQSLQSEDHAMPQQDSVGGSHHQSTQNFSTSFQACYPNANVFPTAEEPITDFDPSDCTSSQRNEETLAEHSQTEFGDNDLYDLSPLELYFRLPH